MCAILAIRIQCILSNDGEIENATQANRRRRASKMQPQHVEGSFEFRVNFVAILMPNILNDLPPPQRKVSLLFRRLSLFALFGWNI